MGFKDRKGREEGSIWNNFRLLITDAVFDFGTGDKNKETVYLVLSGVSPDLPEKNAERTIRWSLGKRVVPTDEGLSVINDDGTPLQAPPSFCTYESVLDAAPSAVLEALDEAGEVGGAATWIGLMVQMDKQTVSVGRFEVVTYVPMAIELPPAAEETDPGAQEPEAEREYEEAMSE